MDIPVFLKKNRLSKALAVKVKYGLPTCFNRMTRNTGISKEVYLAMFAAQGGVCAICKLRCVKALAVDHCHATGKIRGLLCLRCNTALGGFKDDVTVMTNAIEYLQANIV